MGYCWKVLSRTKRGAGHLENAHHFGFKVSNGFRRGRMVACLHCYQSCLATDWVAYKKKTKTRKLLLPVWEAVKSKIGVLGVVALWWGPSSWFPVGSFLLCLFTMEGASQLFGTFSRRALTAYHEASTLKIKAPLKGSPPITVTFGGSDFSIGIWEGHKTFQPQQRPRVEKQTQVREDSCLPWRTVKTENSWWIIDMLWL